MGFCVLILVVYECFIRLVKKGFYVWLWSWYWGNHLFVPWCFDVMIMDRHVLLSTCFHPLSVLPHRLVMAYIRSSVIVHFHRNWRSTVLIHQAARLSSLLQKHYPNRHSMNLIALVSCLRRDHSLLGLCLALLHPCIYLTSGRFNLIAVH